MQYQQPIQMNKVGKESIIKLFRKRTNEERGSNGDRKIATKVVNAIKKKKHKTLE